jgi:hypothetical protein
MISWVVVGGDVWWGLNKPFILPPPLPPPPLLCVSTTTTVTTTVTTTTVGVTVTKMYFTR